MPEARTFVFGSVDGFTEAETFVFGSIEGLTEVGTFVFGSVEGLTEAGTIIFRDLIVHRQVMTLAFAMPKCSFERAKDGIPELHSEFILNLSRNMFPLSNNRRLREQIFTVETNMPRIWIGPCFKECS